MLQTLPRSSSNSIKSQARGHIDETSARAQSRDGIYAALNVFLDDNLLSKLEEEHLFAASEALGVDTDFLWKHPQMLRFLGAGAIRRVLEGEPWDKPWTAAESGSSWGQVKNSFGSSEG